MKIIFDDSVIWSALSDLKTSYIEAIVHDEKINPHSISCDIKTIVKALEGNEEAKNMDLIITARKTKIHDIQISSLEEMNTRLRNGITELKKALNSQAASEDTNEGGNG